MSEGQELARRFHETYERLASSFGYETRIGTRSFDPDTPNGRLMIAVWADAAEFMRDNLATQLDSYLRVKTALPVEQIVEAVSLMRPPPTSGADDGIA
jgi:hypothetical protein